MTEYLRKVLKVWPISYPFSLVTLSLNHFINYHFNLMIIIFYTVCHIANSRFLLQLLHE